MNALSEEHDRDSRPIGDYAVLSAPEFEKETGLPKLSNGQWWRVESNYVKVMGHGFQTRTVGRLFRREIEVEAEVTKYGFRSSALYEQTLKDEIEAFWAFKLRNDAVNEEHRKRIQERNTLNGDYPPKKLGGA